MSMPPRILNPRAVPVAGTDAHLPPVPTPALRPDALRRRFASGASSQEVKVWVDGLEL